MFIIKAIKWIISAKNIKIINGIRHNNNYQDNGPYIKNCTDL